MGYQPGENIYRRRSRNKVRNSTSKNLSKTNNIYSKVQQRRKEFGGRGRSTDLSKSRASFKFSKSITQEKRKGLDYKLFNQKFKERVLRDKVKRLPIPRRDVVSRKSKSKDDDKSRGKRGFFESIKSHEISEASVISDMPKRGDNSPKKMISIPRKMSYNCVSTKNVKGKIRSMMMRSLSRKYKKVIKESLEDKGDRGDTEKLTAIVKDLKKENLQIYRNNDEMKKEIQRLKSENQRLQLTSSEQQKENLSQIKEEKEKVFNLLEEKEEMTGIIEELINEITILKDEIKLMTQAESMNDAINQIKSANRMNIGGFPDWNKSIFKSCDLNLIRGNRNLDILPFLHSIKEEDSETEDYNSDNIDQYNAKKIKSEDEVLGESKMMRRFNSKGNVSKVIENKENIKKLKASRDLIENLKKVNNELEDSKKQLEMNIKILRGKYMQSLMSLRLEKVQVQELKRQLQLSNTSTFMESVLENGKSIFNFENEDKKSNHNDNVKLTLTNLRIFQTLHPVRLRYQNYTTTQSLE